MCTNTKWITNHYTGQQLLVNCGKCPSCQQEKASRLKARCNNSCPDGYIGLFFTLTYMNRFIPYVRRQDLLNRAWPLNVYRDYSHQYYYNKRYKCLCEKIERNFEPIAELDNILYPRDNYLGSYIPPQYDHKLIDLVSKIPDIQTTSKNPNVKKLLQNRISVIFYPDIQNFFKRLRQNITRKLGYLPTFYSHQCSEYGATTFRGHFHGILYVPAELEKDFRTAICKAWPYADKHRTADNIKLDIKAESYVTSYINRPSDFPVLLASPSIRPKHSFSKNSGMVNDAFSLDFILKKASERNLRYTRKVSIDGRNEYVSVPIPQYVINRFFPNFKGVSRLPVSSDDINIYDFIINPFIAKVVKGKLYNGRFTSLDYIRRHFDPFIVSPYENTKFSFRYNDGDIITLADYLSLSDADLFNISGMLKRAAQRLNYRNKYGVLDIMAYAHDYYQVYLAKRMTVLRQWYEKMNWLHFPDDSYDNLSQVLKNKSCPELLVRNFIKPLNTDPNKQISRCSQTDFYTKLFHDSVKKRKVTNVSENQHFYDV